MRNALRRTDCLLRIYSQLLLDVLKRCVKELAKYLADSKRTLCANERERALFCKRL
jgi:hypothetical protein